jgi:hypothetical protein
MHGLVRLAAPRRAFSFDSLVRFEVITRRLLGQPLSLQAWERMTFTDKVTYRRLHVRDPVFEVFCDKLLMREYVVERLGQASVSNLLAVVDDPAQLAQLAGPFVLKANHGSRMWSFVEEGGFLTTEQLHEARSWLGTDYSRVSVEWGYASARPLLLAEELLRSPGGSHPPPDYKFFTFAGKVEMVEVVPGPDSGHRWMLLRPDWTRLTPRRARQPDDPEPVRPPNYDQMLEWASILGSPLDFLRIDMYDLGDRVLVGELSPYPGGGYPHFRPRSLDAWLGTKWLGKPPPGPPTQSSGRSPA